MKRTTPAVLLLRGGLLAFGLLAIAWALGPTPSEAQDGSIQNCPQPGKWAIAVWDGDDGTDAGQALNTCGLGAVAAAYALDPDTQGWHRYILGHREINTLATLDNFQGIWALGRMAASASSSPGSTVFPAQTGTMHNCPQPEKWAISVWDGDDDADVGEALDTCGVGVVAAAYALDPDTQMWYRWIRDEPEISNLATVDNMQGLLVLRTTLEWGEFCYYPDIPSTYYGTVTIDGAPAADGTMISALEGSTTCTTTATSGGRYVFEVPQGMAVSYPCCSGWPWVTFKADGAYCAELGRWSAGAQQLDLSCPAAAFSPVFSASVSDNSALANADVMTDFSISTGSYNYELNITFTPPEFGMGAEDIPLGAHVADLQNEATLGLLNNVCITGLPVAFEMLKATTNTADTISFDDGFADLDGNTLPDAVDKYPDFLNTMYPGITPKSRSYGQASVAGTPVSLNQVVFEPGTTLHGQAFDASLGYGSVSVLNDPTAELEPGSITDFCTPLATTTTRFGITKDNPDTAADESGYVGRANPTAGGPYTFTTFTVGQGDADGDGIENDLDTCPFTVNEGDPRVAGDGDPDNDGLDSACDPEHEVANTDQDDDVYLNRGDNCPLVNNPDNADSDGDRIGDACDPHPYIVDGEGIDVTLTATVTICPPEDQDCDGFDDAVEAYLATDPTDACPYWTDAEMGEPDDCPGPTCDGHDAWPLDNNVDRFVTVVGDALNFRGRIGATPGDPEWLQRLNFNMDSMISVVGDVLMYRGMVGESCT